MSLWKQIHFLKTIKDNNPDAYLQTKLGKKKIQQILTTIQEEIDSFFNDFFYNNFSQPVPRKKNKGTHI